MRLEREVILIFRTDLYDDFIQIFVCAS